MWCSSALPPSLKNRSKCVSPAKALGTACVSSRPPLMLRYLRDTSVMCAAFALDVTACRVFQNVPPDLAICCFTLEQSLSVRALQEMLSNTSLDEVRENEGANMTKMWLFSIQLVNNVIIEHSLYLSLRLFLLSL